MSAIMLALVAGMAAGSNPEQASMETEQRLAILGQQEIVSLLLCAAVEGDGQSVVIGELGAGLDRPQNHFYPRWNGVENPHLLLDSPRHLRGHGLGGAAQAYDEKHKWGTPQKRH